MTEPKLIVLTIDSDARCDPETGVCAVPTPPLDISLLTTKGTPMSTEEDNKRIVIDYYQTAFDGNPEKAVADHFGDRYIQHNAQVADGPAAFIDIVHAMRTEFPHMRLDIKRVIAERDIVATHSHLFLEPGNPGRALADFFRIENGKVVEHWDVIQPIPTEWVNDNGMF